MASKPFFTSVSRSFHIKKHLPPVIVAKINQINSLKYVMLFIFTLCHRSNLFFSVDHHSVKKWKIIINNNILLKSLLLNWLPIIFLQSSFLMLKWGGTNRHFVVITLWLRLFLSQANDDFPVLVFKKWRLFSKCTVSKICWFWSMLTVLNRYN